MTRLSGGEAAVQALLREGIDTVFGLPGIQNDWLYNALYDAKDNIRVLHTRHEQGAAYMALGYALAGDRVGVFNVVPGPGLLNATAALATANSLGAKVLCLTGQIPSESIGRGFGVLHEISDQLGVMRSLTKWAERVNSPAEVPQKIAEAFWQMNSGKPQPAALEIPMDVLERRTEVSFPESLPVYTPPIDESLIDEVAKLLAEAETPMIFVGSGAQGVSRDVKQLAESLQAPVVAYRTGLGVLDSRHYLSLHQPEAKPYWSKADVVIAIGTSMRIPLQKWTKRHTPKVIRIDVDPLSHNKFLTPDVAITASAEHALPVLLNQLEPLNPKRASRKDELHELKTWWQKESSVLEPQLSYLKVIREALGEDGILVDELTQMGFAARITFPVYKPRTFISTGYQGTLGWGFPTALGVKVAKPEVPVISITGDGGFMFAVQELATAVQHKIPLITLLFNNNQYGNVQQMQKNIYGGRVIATDLHNPDFVKLAESFDVLGLRAETPQDLRKAIDQGLENDLPTLIEIPLGDVPSVDRFR